MKKKIAIVSLLLTSICPGQNLLHWNSWTRVNSKVTSAILGMTQLTFQPHSTTYGITGMTQTFSAPASGFYQVRVAGFSSGPRAFKFDVIVGGQRSPIPGHSSGYMSMSRRIYLNQGTQTITFETDTSYFQTDWWDLDQPSITPASSGPPVFIHAVNDGATFEVSTTANFLAVGLAAVPPIRIPGFSHGLELGGPLVILEFSATAKRLSPVIRWNGKFPEVYFQAATLTGFGSVAKL